MSNNFFPETLSDTDRSELTENAKICRGNILSMTTLAASGHPGGSMSSIDILLTLYKFAGITPENRLNDKRDRIILSMGHISPAVYATLAVNGFFSIDDAVSQFRLPGSVFEGHIERSVPGVEWTTGNLGQGLSVACGFALAAKLKGEEYFIYTLMGDGEQQKGQIAEARSLASKYNLSNIIVIIDKNRLQICGNTSDVMPQNLSAEYAADGWNVQEINGHNYDEITAAIRAAQKSPVPSVIIADTVMGKGVALMENNVKYHGSPLSVSDYLKAMAELCLEPALEKYKSMRKNFAPDMNRPATPHYNINISDFPGHFYAADADTDCRSASGATLTDLFTASKGKGKTPMLVFDCDLAGSVKTADIEGKFPENFIQCGISEHNTATAAGAASSQGVITFFAGFTMFTVDEVYNQLRMNDVNDSNLKVISTHAGMDVGEDGKTHQCIDYLGLMRNLFGFKVIAPADPNQTVHAIRYAAAIFGNAHIAMGRSKIPVITDESGNPYFGESYSFEYGSIDELRKGRYPIISYGCMLYRALKVREIAGGDLLGVYNAATPTDINIKSITKLAESGIIFVLEDHIPASGLYSTICQILMKAGIACKVIPFGVERYPDSGAPDGIFKLMGLDPESVAAKIRLLLQAD
ncbi:MAG: transketolase [Deferribacteraceae bacterium]|jgi:transketolase|nr:transketolase [Deferribacteraceae bacterium]